jgi:hypothetical protein
MNEKDRLGDKLRDKGKAAEDLFIAEQERKRREAQQKQAEASAHGLCPRDGAALSQVTERGVHVDTCPTCGGVWLDKGELESILQHDEAAVTRWVRSLLKG